MLQPVFNVICLCIVALAVQVALPIEAGKTGVEEAPHPGVDSVQGTSSPTVGKPPKGGWSSVLRTANSIGDRQDSTELLFSIVGITDTTHRPADSSGLAWPYGGKVDENKRRSLIEQCRKRWLLSDADCNAIVGHPLIFDPAPRFSGECFPALGAFGDAEFPKGVRFYNCEFRDGADFRGAWFSSQRDERYSGLLAPHLHELFGRSFEMDHEVLFNCVSFARRADFSHAVWEAESRFWSTQFSTETRGTTGEKPLQDSAIVFSDWRKWNRSALFHGARFLSGAEFLGVDFMAGADFDRAYFRSSAAFADTRMYDTVSFRYAVFDIGIQMDSVTLDSGAVLLLDDCASSLADSLPTGSFENCDLRGDVHVEGSEFQWVEFSKCRIGKALTFSNNSVTDDLIFDASVFGGTDSIFLGNSLVERGLAFLEVDFGDTTLAGFGGSLSFRGTRVGDLIDFEGSSVYFPLDLSGIVAAQPGNLETKDTSSANRLAASPDLSKRSDFVSQFNYDDARIFSSILIGSQWGIQRHDFSLASFHDRRANHEGRIDTEPMIVINGHVELSLQIEKFRFLALAPDLSYEWKRSIVDHLKRTSFSGDEKKDERFELDYLLARSVAFQKTFGSEHYSRWNPMYWVNWLYGVTLGHGFRPFYLVYWWFGVAALFTVLYFLSFGGTLCESVMEYVGREGDSTNQVRTGRWRSNLEAWSYCLWFSFSVLVAIRIKPRLLTAFDPQEKGLIYTEYLVGLALYAYFLFGSKAGSIGSTLLKLLTG